MGNGDRRSGRRRDDSLKTFERWRTLTWNVEEMNGERSIYFVCDFHGRWLKDLNFLCCIEVLLSVESRVVWVIKIGCLLELVPPHFF